MLKFLSGEVRILGPAIVACFVGSLGLYLLAFRPDGGAEPAQVPTADRANEAPPGDLWVRTGEYEVKSSDIRLIVHAFRLRQDRITVVYSVAHATENARLTGNVAVSNEVGQTYNTVSQGLLGNALGVSLGVVTTEPYKGGGADLILTLGQVSVDLGDGGGSKPVQGAWSIPFLRNANPGVAIDYDMGGRVAPEITSLGDLTLALGSMPGGQFVRLLVDRSGQQSSLYGHAPNGIAVPVTETEFKALLLAEEGISELPLPPDWPAPVSQ